MRSTGGRDDSVRDGPDWCSGFVAMAVSLHAAKAASITFSWLGQAGYTAYSTLPNKKCKIGGVNGSPKPINHSITAHAARKGHSYGHQTDQPVRTIPIRIVSPFGRAYSAGTRHGTQYEGRQRFARNGPDRMASMQPHQVLHRQVHALMTGVS